MDECVIVPVYKRYELLYVCLEAIRKNQPRIKVCVFPDRETFYDEELRKAIVKFDVHLCYVREHPFYGNTFNVMEALAWAYNTEHDRIFYVESDVIVHEDFFRWHREMQEDIPDLFASMAWIFNREAPIVDQVMFQPWYYAVGTCFSREMLGHVVEHAKPEYYEDMPGYIERTFKESKLNAPFAIQHFEHDGLIQRVLDKVGRQTVTSGIARCTHLGFVRSYGYHNCLQEYERIVGAGTFEDRVKRVGAMLNDPYWRASMFGRAIVEREIGYELKPRTFHYRIRIGDYESQFVSELTEGMLPPRINSVRVPSGAQVELIE